MPRTVCGGGGGEARAPADRVGGGARGWNIGYGAHRGGGPAPVRPWASLLWGRSWVGSGRFVVGWVLARCWVLRERAWACCLDGRTSWSPGVGVGGVVVRTTGGPGRGVGS